MAIEPITVHVDAAAARIFKAAPHDERLLTDGAFIETEEHLLSFSLMDVPDRDDRL